MPPPLEVRQIKIPKTIQMVAATEATLPGIRWCHEAMVWGTLKPIEPETSS